MQIEVVLAAAIGILGIASAPLVPLLWRLSIALALSVPQIYIVPVGGAWISLAFMSAYFLWPEFIKELPGMLRSGPMVAFLALLVIQVVSWSWAPELFAGFRALVFSLPFVFIVAATYSLARSDAGSVKYLFVSVPILMLGQLAMVVAFRLSPSLELSYLQSDFAGILSGPNTVSALLDGTNRNNVFNFLKSGGVYVNANTAAAYLGIGAFLAFQCASLLRVSVLNLVAALLWVGVFFTGSKAGAAFAISLPVILVVTRQLIKYDLASKMVALFAALLFAVFSVVLFASAATWLLRESQLVANTAITTGVRLLIWARAGQLFVESPVFGLGYGGWHESFSGYAMLLALNPDFPPHNSLIQLWADSGILAVVAAVVFVASLL